jgi:hypothetical protein
MAMSAGTLKANLKTDLLPIFTACNTGPGISDEDYADRIAEAIASNVVEHITNSAEVSGTAGGYKVSGKVT